jgi:hypothetical protein
MYEAALSAYGEDRGVGSVDRLGAQAKQRLRLAVDQVKIDLSGEDSVTLSVDMGTAFCSSILAATADSNYKHSCKLFGLVLTWNCCVLFTTSTL